MRLSVVYHSLNLHLKEVLELCFEEQAIEVPQFVGIQQIEIEV